jgi:LmbE family N-acetylglucosaminyl deacetylase
VADLSDAGFGRGTQTPGSAVSDAAGATGGATGAPGIIRLSVTNCILISGESCFNGGVAITRRQLLAAAAVPLFGQTPARPLKIVVAGGHPGDPECGCAGTIARYTDLGHQVTLLYLNRGEGYCGKADLAKCAAIRTDEATQACRILKARPLFADQYDGRAVVDNAHYETFGRIVSAENPDVVFTHWPTDRHRDHRALSMLTLDAWWKDRMSWALYYYEVAGDTTMFTPSEYVDISATEPRRRAACYAHASQQPDKWYPEQVSLTRAHGAARGLEQADGFLRHPDSKRAFLPQAA